MSFTDEGFLRIAIELAKKARKKWARISKIVYSVSQCTLQQLSGGRPKPCCDIILNTGKRKIKVVVPLIPEERVQVFQNNKFIKNSYNKIKSLPFTLGGRYFLYSYELGYYK